MLFSKYFNSKKLGGVALPSLLISFLALVELTSLKGYSASVETIMFNTSWWMEDYFSVSLISLTMFVILISLIASDDDFMLDSSWSKFATMVVLIGLSCMCFFCCADFFLFFFFFESSLIPTAVLILSWGHQPERLQAGLQMIIYTVCGSLPFLVLLCGIWLDCGTDKMMIMCFTNQEMISESVVFWFLLMIGMLVKVPVFLVHGWLPKAHVEAPLSGSMMLAGILLKLGIYGICRVLLCVGIPPMEWVYVLMVVSLWGGVVCSFLCLCFYDIKSVIAYSSIAHMSLSLGGIMSLSQLGWMGGICMAIAHGICSPCLFSLANYTYMGSGSRSILLCKGLLKSLPMLSAMWFVFCAINMGCPPSINFFSECLLFCSILGYSTTLISSLFLLCFLAAGYSLFLYSTVNHGYQSFSLRGFSGLSLRFMVCMVVSMIILFGLFIFLDVVFL
uniref:NADH-ubiquinone oxidoreductase chain 4 n=1 Tax=Macoma balthica TaxID=1903275 RepID=A0A0B4U4U9_MACBL|nr:NADH deshydrogenase subunit 4 [Macoma balthica]